MPTGNTTLLGLALPVEGELDGTWGDVVNDSITSLVDSAVAGTTTLGTDADVTLTTTALASNQARQAVLLWTASNGATTRNITAPAQSKPYIVINAGTGSIVLRGAGPTTGITIVSGEKCLAAWNGSDFVKIATSATTTGTVTSVGWTGGIVSVATATTTPAFTIAGTSGGIPYFNSGTTWATSAALAANALVIGGGAGAAPATTTTGTGVITALGVAANAATGFITGDGTATLTNKTISADSNTLSGIAASSFVLSNGSGNIDGAAAQKAIPSGLVVGDSDTQTLSNKRIDPRNVVAASASTLTPDVSVGDIYAYTALAAGLTINAPIGTPTDGDKLIFRLLDNGTARALTWNATYTAIGVTLPTTTVINKTTYVGCIYNANNTRWDVIAVTTQA
jgi:hypothetical protein